VLSPSHLCCDCLADNIPRRQFAGRIIVSHKAVSVAVDQVRPFAADRFGNQVSRAAGDIQDGGMELHEFHVTHNAAGTHGSGMTIRRCDLRICGFPIQGPCSARAKNCLLGPDECPPVVLIPHQCPAAGLTLSEQVQSEGFGPEVDVRLGQGKLVHGPHDLKPRRVAQRVGHAGMTVTTLQSQCQLAINLVKLCTELSQLKNPLRSLTNYQIHDIGMAQPFAGRQSVRHVAGVVVQRVQGTSYATLSVGTVGMLQ
jgi:hypothetical protein